MKINEGEVPQYYVTSNHEPIIDPVTWDTVQAEPVSYTHLTLPTTPYV